MSLFHANISPTLPWDDDTIRRKTEEAVAFLWAARRAAGTKDIDDPDEEDPVEDEIQQQEDSREEPAKAADDTRSGKHLDGFCRILTMVAQIAGYTASDTTKAEVRSAKKLELPGYFRATKKWDLIVVRDERLIAAIELKSMGGSYGKNMNNRTEEALGSAIDVRKATERGIIDGMPWLGYLYVIREEPVSTSPRKTAYTAALPVDTAFQRKSYVERYGEFCKRLKESGLYDETAYLVSPRGVDASDEAGLNETGTYAQPVMLARMETFLRGFYEHLHANR